MSAPEGYFTVYHGSLSVNVPRSLFKGMLAVVDGKEADSFYELVRSRYPWITRNSFDVMMEKARTEYLRIRES